MATWWWNQHTVVRISGSVPPPSAQRVTCWTRSRYRLVQPAIVHPGFLEGPDWDAYMEYFVDAWGYVLGQLADHWQTT